MSVSTDRIEKEILLKAPQSRVWQALANAEEFGQWFRADFKGAHFVAGQFTQGKLLYPGYEHLTLSVLVESIEPERRLCLRWHPYAIDPAQDFSQEPMTLIEFTMQAVAAGTLLRVVESGFDQIPLSRRHEAFRMNSDGWAAQMKNIASYVDAA